MVNRQKTSAVVEINTPGSPGLYKDLRLRPDQLGDLVLHIVPLLQELRGARFRLRVLLPFEQKQLGFEPTNFSDPSVCANAVELCGLLLVGEAAEGSAPATDQLAGDAATGDSIPLDIIGPNLPAALVASVEELVRARVEPVGEVMGDYFAHTQVIGRKKLTHTARWLMERVDRAGSMSPDEVLALFGDALFILGCLDDAAMLVRRSAELRPDDPKPRDLLRRIVSARQRTAEMPVAARPSA